MKKISGNSGLLIVLSILSFTFFACGDSATGGTEAGNPPSLRTITGKVPEAAGCVADTAVAQDTDGAETETDIENDCSFSLGLTAGRSYSLRFTLQGEGVAAMTFNNGPSDPSAATFFLPAGEDPLGLGQITFQDGTATPEIEPATESDQDDDGLSDFEDPDDEGDGTIDNIAEILGVYAGGSSAGNGCPLNPVCFEIEEAGEGQVAVIQRTAVADDADPCAEETFVFSMTGTFDAGADFNVSATDVLVSGPGGTPGDKTCLISITELASQRLRATCDIQGGGMVSTCTHANYQKQPSP